MKFYHIVIPKMDRRLRQILKRQIPCFVGGVITGVLLAYSFEFLFSFTVNTAVWFGISFLINKFYFKSNGLNDQKYLIEYAKSIIISRINK
jgi:hypothetical protein